MRRVCASLRPALRTCMRVRAPVCAPVRAYAGPTDAETQAHYERVKSGQRRPEDTEVPRPADVAFQGSPDLPPDFPQAPKDAEPRTAKLPPEDPKLPMEPTANVRAAVEAICKLTYVETVILGHEMARISGMPYDVFVQGAYNAAPGMLGVQTQAAAPGAAAPAPGGKEEKKAPAKKEIEVADVKLVSFPEGAKFNVLREVRKLKPGMNLMDSKKLVENLPQILAKKVPKAELKKWEEGLKAAGAEFEFLTD